MWVKLWHSYTVTKRENSIVVVQKTRAIFVSCAARPSNTVLDESICCVLWFMLRGVGKDYDTGEVVRFVNHINNQKNMDCDQEFDTYVQLYAGTFAFFLLQRETCFIYIKKCTTVWMFPARLKHFFNGSKSWTEPFWASLFFETNSWMSGRDVTNVNEISSKNFCIDQAEKERACSNFFVVVLEHVLNFASLEVEQMNCLPGMQGTEIGEWESIRCLSLHVSFSSSLSLFLLFLPLSVSNLSINLYRSLILCFALSLHLSLPFFLYVSRSPSPDFSLFLLCIIWYVVLLWVQKAKMNRFEVAGPACVANECELELRRLGIRNGGRDGRMAAQLGVQLRFILKIVFEVFFSANLQFILQQSSLSHNLSLK